MKRVKANSTYIYNPAGVDLWDARTDLKEGTMLRVINLPGCPKASTLGHCHVADPQTGSFIGLVCAASLDTVEEYRAYLQRKIAEHRKEQ